MSKPDVVRLDWDVYAVRFSDDDISVWDVDLNSSTMKAKPPTGAHSAAAIVELRAKMMGGISLYCFRCKRADDCSHAGEVNIWTSQP